MTPIDWIVLSGKFIKGIWDAFPGWLKASIAGLVVLSLWTWWAIDHGKGIQRAKDEAQLAQCHANVSTLQGAVKTQNDGVDAMAKAAAQNAADSDKAAQGALKASGVARKQAARLDVGPEPLNAFLRETFQ